jgi:outer membrane protein OmpA-like peptidoglycan-associated protein
MATERVKVYEDGRRGGGMPLWAWLLPLLLILALLAWYLLHRGNNTGAQTAAPTTVGAPAGASGVPALAAVHFATDSADLTPDDQATLSQAAAYMKQHPEAHIRLEGYTDATGNDPHNQTLSQRRSQSVAAFLKGQGVEGTRLTGEGFGPQNPVDTNATESGKADNRRVELFTQP